MIEQDAEQSQSIVNPRCPYCRMDPAGVTSAPFQIGPFTELTLFCSNPACRKILAIQLIGVQEKQQQSIITSPNGDRIMQ